MSAEANQTPGQSTTTGQSTTAGGAARQASGCAPAARLDDEYLNQLAECEAKAIDEYDKAIMTLSAAAIGISFAFIKDVVKVETTVYRGWLIGAWSAWAASIFWS